LTTGDQSLFEAISARKVFLYEQFEHKATNFDDLLSIASMLSPEGPLVTFLESVHVKKIDKLDDNLFDRVGALLANPALAIEFAALNAYVAKDCDIAPRIVAKSKRYLHRWFMFGKCEELFLAVADMEDRVLR